MARHLESPSGDRADWDVLYLARGADQVVAHRPIFTGDVFQGVPVLTPRGDKKTKTVMVIKHTCAMRPNGADLAESLLVAEVRQHPEVAPNNWKGYGKLMPLPDVFPAYQSGRRHQAAFYDHTYHAHADDLAGRVACLSLRGMNLLLQRWVYHSARIVVPTFDFDEVVSPVFEEADLIEEWCGLAIEHGHSVDEARHDVATWLKEETGGISRRQALEDRQRRPEIRREVRSAAGTWRAPAPGVAAATEGSAPSEPAEGELLA